MTSHVSRILTLLVLQVSLMATTVYGHSSGGYPPDVHLKSVQKSGLPDPGSFVSFETAHVHPLDLNPANSLLAAVNTADARVELFAVDGNGALTHLKAIAVGVDPVTARFRTNTELWVVNHISDSISVIDTATATVVATIATEDEPADVIFFADTGNADPLAAVTCSRVDTVQIFNASTRALVDTLPILGEDPRALATNGTDVFGAVFMSGNSTTIIGHVETDAAVSDVTNPYGGLGTGSPRQPYNDGVPGTEWVTPHGSKDASDLVSEGKPPAIETGIIVRKDFDDGNKWKDDNGADWTPWVSGAKAHLSGRQTGWDMIDNDIFSFSTASGTSSLDASFGASGYVINRMNICMAIGVNPFDGSVVMVGTEATNEIRFEPVLTGTFVRTRVAIADPADGSEIALVDMNEEHLDAAQSGIGTAYEDGTVAQSERDKSIGDPRGIAFHPADGRIYVTGMGSDNVIVLDKDTGARLGGVGYTIEVPTGPTGAIHHASLNRLYVQSKFDASVTAIDTTTIGAESVLQNLPYHDPTPEWVNEGRVHMYDTHANSGLGQVACASCHIDGAMDRLSWDLGDPLGEMKPTTMIANLASPQAGEHNLSFSSEGQFDDFHFMKGPMATQTLQDIIGKEPHHWRGDRDGIEEFAGAFSGLQGRDTPLDATSMQEFENFLSSIHFPPNDFRALDNSLAGGPKFFGAGTNPLMPLPNHFTSGRFSAEGNPLPDGNAWRGFQMYVDGDPDFVDGKPELDGDFHCVSCHALPMGAGSIDFFDPNVFNFVDIAAGPMGEAHQAIVAVDGTGERAFKIAPTRNQLDKVGLFMSPDPSNGGAPHLSRSGFGVLHDGSVAGIDTFLASNVFDFQSDQDVADMVAFVLSMNGSDFEHLMGLSGGPTGFPAGQAGVRPPGPDGGLARTAHAAVGKQLTLDTGMPGAMDQDLLDLFVDMADAQDVDLIAKQPGAGIERGWVYDAATDTFFSDEDGESLTEAELLALAGSGNELTFTIVPAGSGIRMGIDRDEDTVGDFTETENGTSPTDPEDGMLMVAYVDFAYEGAETGQPATPFNTLSEAIASIESGVIRINSQSSTLTTSELFSGGGEIVKAITIEAYPPGAGAVRIGVLSKGLLPLKDTGAGSDGGVGDKLTGNGESDVDRLLALFAARFGQASDEDDDTAEIREGAVRARVLPYTRATSGERILEPGSSIAFRLRGDAAIDPTSVWGAPEGTSARVIRGEHGDLRDVWVVVSPDETHFFSGVYELAVGAQTVTGAGIVSETESFIADPVAEPIEAPSLPEIGLDVPQGIVPEVAYDTPQRIWLPIPAGMAPDNVQLFYFHADGAERGWYPAEQVDGWLVPGSYTVTRQNGMAYLGFLVRHAGIVQLGSTRTAP